MHPVSLLDLPNELLYKIIGLLEHKDLHTLSSTGIKELYPLLEPLLYNSIEIKLFNDSIRLMHNKSGGKPNKSQLQYVQSLTITMDQPYYPNEKVGPIKRWGAARIGTSLFSKSHWKDLKDVVTSSGNVTTVRWLVSSPKHSAHQHKQSIPWGTCIDFNPVLKLIASLPSLETFSCNISNIHPGHPLTWKSTKFGLENLHSLKSVSFAVHCGGDFWALTIEPLIFVMRNSPELEYLSLDFTHIVYAHKAGSLSLEKLLQRFPFSQPLKLRKLSLRVPVWNLRISRPSGIHLRNLTTLELRFPTEASFPSNPPLASTHGGLWAALSYHGARIKHLYAPVASELFDYIQTYSGIESLRLYGIANDTLESRFHACLRRHMGSLKVLNISLIASTAQRWAFADHNTHVFAECLELRELWVSIDSENTINSLMLLLRTCNSLPHLHWLSIGPAVHPDLYGSTKTHTLFLQWMYSTKKKFSELDITEILNLDPLNWDFMRMHVCMTFTIDLGFYRLRGSWGVEPVPSHMLQDRSYQNFDPSRVVVEVIKPKASQSCELISFHWVVEFMIHDGKKFLQSEWPYRGPMFAIADGVEW